MRNKDYKAIIVEGELREPQIIENIFRIHFKNSNFKMITLPAGQNIYMLWQKMKEDNFLTDIIEVLREYSKELQILLDGLGRDDFSEIFFFFDFDGHQKNLRNENLDCDVIEEMLVNFDNETENGKLYISYPMVEAVRDFIPQQCALPADCFCQIQMFEQYKNISGINKRYLQIGKYDFAVWQMIMNVFAMRVSCLFEEEQVVSHQDYMERISPYTIYQAQSRYINRGEVFILSAFPEFLLDYFRVDFWNANIKYKRRRAVNCKLNNHT